MDEILQAANQQAQRITEIGELVSRLDRLIQDCKDAEPSHRKRRWQAPATQLQFVMTWLETRCSVPLVYAEDINRLMGTREGDSQ